MSPIYKAYNPITRKFEEVDINDMELVPGMEIIVMYWSAQHQQYMTVPGASRYVVNESFDLVLATD